MTATLPDSTKVTTAERLPAAATRIVVAFPTWPGFWAACYFVVHQPVALLPIPNGGEKAALFAWIFLLIAALGPGALALDNLRRR